MIAPHHHRANKVIQSAKKMKKKKEREGRLLWQRACLYKFASIKRVKLQAKRAKRICACVSACVRAPVCAWEGRNLGWSLISASSSGNKHFWGWSSEEGGTFLSFLGDLDREGGLRNVVQHSDTASYSPPLS
jgi:hypothetical protein